MSNENSPSTAHEVGACDRLGLVGFENLFLIEVFPGVMHEGYTNRIRRGWEDSLCINKWIFAAEAPNMRVTNLSVQN